MDWKHLLLGLFTCLTSACFCGPRPPIYDPVLLDSGVTIQDIVRPDPGPEAQDGDIILLHYKMMLEDGTEVDSSFVRGQPIQLQLGQGALPIGLEEGIRGMRLFSQRRVRVPAPLAYGEEGLEGQVPPNALLEFFLELMGLNPDL